jgi:RimK family alpha-L-glutamate ligase
MIFRNLHRQGRAFLLKTSTVTCWMIVNGYLQQQKFSELSLFIKIAAERVGIELRIVSNTDIISYMEHGQSMITTNFGDERPDLVLFMDKDIHLAKQLEGIGLPVYNRADAIALCDSKALTHQALANHGIMMPKTVFPPFTYDNIARKDFESFRSIGKLLEFPLIIKEAYGSFGEQVYLISTEQELLDKVEQLGATPFIIQEFISTSKGRDLRLNVIGDRVVAAMKRTSEHDFRANVTMGGQMEPYTPTEEEAALAVDCAHILGTDFAGVDLLFGEDGPLLCEVNSNSHVVNIFHSTGINVADHMMAHMLATYKGRTRHD